jgi:hypothetical protein
MVLRLNIIATGKRGGKGEIKKTNPFDLKSASFCHRGVRCSVGTHSRVLDADANILKM